MEGKKKNNPYVSLATCNARHTELNIKISEILTVLRGDLKNKNDMGIVGDLQDMKQERKWEQKIFKWVIALATASLIAIITFIMKMLMGV